MKHQTQGQLCRNEDIINYMQPQEQRFLPSQKPYNFIYFSPQIVTFIYKILYIEIVSLTFMKEGVKESDMKRTCRSMSIKRDAKVLISF